MSIDALCVGYDAVSQGYLFTFQPQLSETGRAALAAQSEAIDIECVNPICT
jgi:hypothetical protein